MNRKIVLLRHGESVWNKEGIFTGWVDEPLSDHGREEAAHAGQLMKKSGLGFDLAVTSFLQRSHETLGIVLSEMGLDIPVIKTWRLNERHYGGLQGRKKTEILQEFGEEKFHEWRRSYDVPPPPIEPGSRYDAALDPKYEGVPVPKTECLADVVARVMPFWEDEVLPRLGRDEKMLLVIHGNSIRAILGHLEKMSKEDVSELEIPTAVPIVLEFDDDSKFLRKDYLGDKEDIERRMRSVRDQGHNNSYLHW